MKRQKRKRVGEDQTPARCVCVCVHACVPACFCVCFEFTGSRQAGHGHEVEEGRLAIGEGSGVRRRGVGDCEPAGLRKVQRVDVPWALQLLLSVGQCGRTEQEEGDEERRLHRAFRQGNSVNVEP